MENQGFHGAIYTGEGSVNLREFQARQENPSNLDLCEDELFNDLFPRNSKESEMEKEKGNAHYVSKIGHNAPKTAWKATEHKMSLTF